MNIPESFYESEVREGFYVPSFMKRSWAATLEILNEIAIICERHELKWWMDWGSLLATVRHGGFIPWDDDLDISMMREDYRLFLQYANEELPKGYFANNIFNNQRFDEFHTRLVNTTELDRSDDFLNRSHGFPYLAGVDIFCIDYLSRDDKINKLYKERIFTIGSVASAIPGDSLLKDVPQYEAGIRDIEALCNCHFKKEKPIRQQINILCDKLMQYSPKKESDHATCMVLYTGREYFGGVFPKEFYEEYIYMPYEFLTVPVPLHYNEILKGIFGNYMKPVRSGGVHEYPYYSQQEKLLSEQGERLPREIYEWV
ncbi:MAG: LicD family protein [Lachnospiraceae bacterium]|nr:LicD family protein [Lachnospiraceae bacterium]